MPGPRPITPATALCGVVLHPAGHTRSPAMHNAAFAALGLDAVYLAFDVPSAALGAAVTGARALGLRQLAVSIPHKEAIRAHVDEVDPVALAIGAVNTVTLRDGHLEGANTDWIGAVNALESVAPLSGRQAVVLGAGGTARAVVYGLLDRGATVTVLNRTARRAEALAKDFEGLPTGALSDLADLPYDVLVNTTSVGLGADESPVAPAALRKGSIVMDAVYEPERTRLLRDAATAGATPVGGKWMLIHQAAAQLMLWSGNEAPISVMADAFDAAAQSAAGGGGEGPTTT